MASSPSPSPSPSPPGFLALPPPSLLSASPCHKPLLLPPPVTKPQSPPKKPPPFTWTHQETLALIQAYQEKWYSLKKGQLKAFQWEEVSATVSARCGFDEPSKTATQCRHKIEKLRKRYRSELKKPYPNSWQYFDYMDQLEHGPMPLDARPIAVVKSSPNLANTNANNSNGFSRGYGSLYSDSTDYYLHRNNHGDVNVGVSDESDEEWNAGYSVEAMAKSKLKSINPVSRPNATGGHMAMGSGSVRGVRMSRYALNGKRKQYFDVGNNDHDDDGDDDDSVDEDHQVRAGEGGDSGETELAAEIKGFAETFTRMENWKIEIMQEMERHRMEMEKKRMDMILDTQRKIIDTIGRTFGSCKKARMDQEY